jgi:hypothetical protein
LQDELQRLRPGSGGHDVFVEVLQDRSHDLEILGTIVDN